MMVTSVLDLVVCTCSPLLPSMDRGYWYDEIYHRYHWDDSAGAINAIIHMLPRVFSFALSEWLANWVRRLERRCY